MPIVLAAPLTSPGGTGALNHARSMSWTGFDGSFWDLTDVYGPMQLREGVKGLHMPPMTVFQSSTPLVPGAEIGGYSIDPRPVYWPLTFIASSSDEWRRAYSDFFRSLHPTRPGIWKVGSGDDARTLPLTYTPDGGAYAFKSDPFVNGVALIGLELVATRPLWRGKSIKQEFRADEPVDFIPAAPGDEYFPSPVATFSTATIENPGDEPSYLLWTVEGPQSELELGVDGAVIRVPFDVADGSTLIIDTDPAGQYATLDGVDVTAALGFQMFGPVPARGRSPLTIQSAGAGAVTAELVPLYWTAA